MYNHSRTRAPSPGSAYDHAAGCIMLRLRPGSLQPQHVRHRVAAGRPADQPQGGLDRAPGEDRAAFGPVAELEPLALGGEDGEMLARDRAAAERGEADPAGLARSGEAVAAALGDGVELNPPPLRPGAAQHQRRS